MNRQELRELCEQRMLVCDGPLGAILRARIEREGPPPEPTGVPERLALEEIDALTAIHQASLTAGADILLTNTFAANGPALEALGRRDELEEIARQSVHAARRAIESADRRRDGTPLLGFLLGPLPTAIEPRGPMRFEEAVNAYREVAQAVADQGVDLFVLDSIEEIRNLKAALIALREVAPEAPVIAQMTFRANGRTEGGSSPAVLWTVARSLGADFVGASGGLAPEEMLPVVAAFQAVSDLPLILQPRLLPYGDGGEPLAPPEFLRQMRRLLDRGPAIVGVSGAPSPEWLQGLAKLSRKHAPGVIERAQRLVLASDTRDLEIGPRRGIVTAVEWPASRGHTLRAARTDGLEGLVYELRKAVEAGAQLLEVRSTLPQIDEPAFLADLLPRIEEQLHVPLMIGAETRKGLETALRLCAGRPLISAVWNEPDSLERVLPLAHRYGAAVVAVCHTGEAIPTTAEERVAIAEQILEKAIAAGLRQDDLIFDPVAFPAKTEPVKLRETLRTLALLKERLGQPTLVRLSGVSDELPARTRAEASFLAMAGAVGLDLAIVSSANARVIDAAVASSLIMGRDREAKRYLTRFGEDAVDEGGVTHRREERGPRRERMGGERGYRREQTGEERDPRRERPRDERPHRREPSREEHEEHRERSRAARGRWPEREREREERAPRREWDREERPPRREPGGEERPSRRPWRGEERDVRREGIWKPPQRRGAGYGERHGHGGFGDGRERWRPEERPPRRGYGERGERGGFGERRERRDFGERPARRSFDERGGRRDFGERRERGGSEDRRERWSPEPHPQRRYQEERPGRERGGFGERPERRDFAERPKRRRPGAESEERPAREPRESRGRSPRPRPARGADRDRGSRPKGPRRSGGPGRPPSRPAKRRPGRPPKAR